jgi:hypothetical protein
LGVSDAEFEAAMNDPEINDAKVTLAEDCARYWRSIAPVRSGRYRSSIRTEIGSDNVVRVVADTPYAAALEYGSETVHEGAYRSQTEAAFAYRED